MNNMLIPKECDFLKISVFFIGTLKGRTSALAGGISSPIVVLRSEVQPAAQQAQLDGDTKERLHCLLPAVVLATQFRGEFEQSDFIILSLIVSHLFLFYEY